MPRPAVDRTAGQLSVVKSRLRHLFARRRVDVRRAAGAGSGTRGGNQRPYDHDAADCKKWKLYRGMVQGRRGKRCRRPSECPQGTGQSLHASSRQHRRGAVEGSHSAQPVDRAVDETVDRRWTNAPLWGEHRLPCG